jgi:hypothetical protein
MTTDYLSCLILRGLVAGHNATPTDYADTLRCLRDQCQCYAQWGDETGTALCSLAIGLLCAAMTRKGALVPF